MGKSVRCPPLQGPPLARKVCQAAGLALKSKNISPQLPLIYPISEEVMALANTMKLARFANGPLARYGMMAKNILN